MCSSDLPINASLVAPQKPLEIAPNLMTKRAKFGDKFDTPYIKEESNKNNTIPPTPQTGLELNLADSVEPARLVLADAKKPEELVSADANTGGENLNLDFKKEDKAWSQAVKILASKLSKFDLNCWIQPMIFEKGEESVGVLRLPNEFFKHQVEKKFGAEIIQAFKKAGVCSVSFELMTSSQQEEVEKKRLIQVASKLSAEKQASQDKASLTQAQLANIESLPLESKFDLLYATYPVHKERERACTAFMRLAKKNQLPAMSELFQSIKEHQAKDRWWREKMPPLLCNWLTNRKWQDKPYE